MSKLQFIVDVQWSLLCLILVIVGSLWVWLMPTEKREAIRKTLLARSIKASVGSVSVEVGAPASAEAIAKATAPDEQLTKELPPSATETPEEQVQQIRRDAVEQVMREAAEWGWTMAQVGFKNPPSPQITWNGDKPEINYGFSDLERSLLRITPGRNMPGI